MDAKELIGIITILLSIIGHAPYIIDTWKGKTKPHLFTWVTWSIIVAIAFLGQWVSGGGAGSWGTGVTGAMVVIIALLAIRKGTKDIARSDKIFFAAALIGIIPWIITKDPTLSIIVISVIDFCAYVPTIRKTINDPGSETLITYLLNLVRHPLSLFAISQYNLATVLYPAYLSAMSLIIVVIILRGRKARNVKLI